MGGEKSYVPPKKHRKVDEKMTNPDKMVPAFPEEQLECLLNTSIDLYEKGAAIENEESQQFFRDNLIVTFTKILTGNAVNSWTPYAHDCVKMHCEKVVKLCIHKLDTDTLPLLDLLAIIFDPNNKFHTFNAAKQSTSVPPGSEIPDEKIYARPPADPENPRGWLVDLINKFGDLGGFSILLTKFQSCRCCLTIPIIRAMLRPFGLCQELLTLSTIVKYLFPIFEEVGEILDNLTDEQLKKEAQNQSISHDMSVVMKTMTSLASRVPQSKDIIAILESSRLKIILRLSEIVENIQELLDNTIYNLSSKDLNYFFQGFQQSWTTGSTEEREKLLDFVCQLLAYDQNNAMIDKILTAFWNIAHSDDVSTDVMELALDTHLQFLDYPGVQDRDALKNVWLDKCVDELKSNDNWTLQTMKQIRKICNSLFESQVHRQPSDFISYKKEVIGRLIDHHSIFTFIENSMPNYINKARQLVKQNFKMKETIFLPDGRYNHVIQVQERLDFHTFVLRNSGYVVNIHGAKRKWQWLGEQPVFPSDREACLKWFVELISVDRPRIEAVYHKDIFDYVIQRLDPTLFAEIEFTFFDKFFKAVNIKEGKLKNQNGIFFIDDMNLIGKDYLWRIITDSQDDIAHRGMELLMDVHKNRGSEIKIPVWKFHLIFIAECTSRLENISNTLVDLTKVWNFRGKKAEQKREKITMESVKNHRVKEIQKKYLNQFNIALPAIDTNNGA